MSSIDRIFSNGVMGLTAQSNALSVISDNVANASTNGYKRSDTQFSDFVVKDKYGSAFTGAGVLTSDRLLADRQGSISQTGVTTNAAISGNGFFIVQEMNNGFADKSMTSAELTKLGNDPELTRAGDFSADAYDHLVNGAGMALLGQRLESGSTSTALATSIDQLELVSVGEMRDYYEGSTTVAVQASLPTDATVTTDPTSTNAFNTTVTAVDNNGQQVAVQLAYIKTAQADDGGATWATYVMGATDSSGNAISDVTTGQIGTMTFGPGGELTGGTAGDPVNFEMNLGANFTNPVTLNIGYYNQANGLTMTSTGTMNNQSDETDGIAAGTFSDIEITDDGYLRASYTGGQERDFYRIPNGYVRSANGLESISGTAFRATADSGEIQIKSFGVTNASSVANGGTGTTTADSTRVGAALVANAVEQSNTDIASEFTTLIVAQRTYSANSKVVTTADELTQTVLGLKT